MFEAQVARGAALLDERVPGWYKRVADTNLSMSNCQKCVLGTLFDGFYNGKDALGLHTIYDRVRADSTAAHGFDISRWETPEAFLDVPAVYDYMPVRMYERKWKMLEDAWYAAIQERLAREATDGTSGTAEAERREEDQEAPEAQPEPAGAR